MLNDTIANALSVIAKSESLGRPNCTVTPTNRVLGGVLRILNEEGYCGAAEEVTAARGGATKINLLGTINSIGVIKPRFAVKWDGFERFEKRFLPAKALGVLIVSTSEGLMTHTQAKKKKIGGRLIAYCY